MRKWKDDGSDLIKPRQRKLYFLLSMLFITKPLIFFILKYPIDGFDLFGSFMGFVLMWGTNFNGFYKISRKITEWDMKRRDNKWR